MPRFFQEIAGLIMGMIKGIMVVNNPLIVPYFRGGGWCIGGEFLQVRLFFRQIPVIGLVINEQKDLQCDDKCIIWFKIEGG